MLAFVDDKHQIRFRRKPAVHQQIMELKPIVQTLLNYCSHQLIFGFYGHSFNLFGFDITKLNRFFDRFKGNGYRNIARMIQSIQ
jgi:hypothetical protein